VLPNSLCLQVGKVIQQVAQFICFNIVVKSASNLAFPLQVGDRISYTFDQHQKPTQCVIKHFQTRTRWTICDKPSDIIAWPTWKATGQLQSTFSESQASFAVKARRLRKTTDHFTSLPPSWAPLVSRFQASKPFAPPQVDGNLFFPSPEYCEETPPYSDRVILFWITSLLITTSTPTLRDHVVLRGSATSDERPKERR